MAGRKRFRGLSKATVGVQLQVDDGEGVWWTGTVVEVVIRQVDDVRSPSSLLIKYAGFAKSPPEWVCDAARMNRAPRRKSDFELEKDAFQYGSTTQGL